MVSAALNGNLSVLALRHRHGKHAIVELRSNFVGINRVRRSQSAQERAVLRTVLHPIAGPAVKYIIEQPVHLPMKRKEWMPEVALQETA
jgi:hypothetical protein